LRARQKQGIHLTIFQIYHMCILVTPRAAIAVHGCSIRTGYALPLPSIALDLRPDSPHHEFLADVPPVLNGLTL
jgi:hypothetical protein